jgi:hypothetical protein
MRGRIGRGAMVAGAAGAVQILTTGVCDGFTR